MRRPHGSPIDIPLSRRLTLAGGPEEDSSSPGTVRNPRAPFIDVCPSSQACIDLRRRVHYRRRFFRVLLLLRPTDKPLPANMINSNNKTLVYFVIFFARS